MSTTDIVALIPAAGRGSRLAPFPCPKELFPVGYQDYPVGSTSEKRPKVVSQYLVENMRTAGAKRLFIILGEGKADIMSYYGDGSRFDLEVAYLYQEQLTGMPGALDLATPHIAGATVVFGMPDTIIEPHDLFAKLLAEHQDNAADLTLGLFPTDNPSKFGMVEIDAENNVLSTIDKPAETERTFMWGCACWSPRFTNLLHTFLADNPYAGREIVLGDVFDEALHRDYTVKGIPFPTGQYIDIGTAAELNSALKRFHL